MNIEWSVLGEVALVSVLLTVALVGLFTVGIVTGAGQGGTAAAGRPRLGTALSRVGGYACFALCAAAVAYGIYLIAF
ncbi:hypothetical protein ACFV5N_22670 [Streptomyces sp. NPDC059853]|uniref:hypothetical protein n=1 Tax=Streptomyces sp. NPDC059853 TaxID=3346973 RepID=UPI0036527F5A